VKTGSDTPIDDSRPVRRGRRTAFLIGSGRVAVGTVFAVNPAQSMRFLGVDTGTATRLTWLAQMTAARDIAVGLGTAATAVTGRGSDGWLLAGAACDAADAAAIAAALARKQVSAVASVAVIAVATLGSIAAVATVLRSSRRSPTTSG
jgi:hypothetical protein